MLVRFYKTFFIFICVSYGSMSSCSMVQKYMGNSVGVCFVDGVRHQMMTRQHAQFIKSVFHGMRHIRFISEIRMHELLSEYIKHGSRRADRQINYQDLCSLLQEMSSVSKYVFDASSSCLQNQDEHDAPISWLWLFYANEALQHFLIKWKLSLQETMLQFWDCTHDDNIYACSIKLLKDIKWLQSQYAMIEIECMQDRDAIISCLNSAKFCSNDDPV